MKQHLTKLLSAGLLTAVAVGATVFGFNGTAAANASCRWQYQSDGNFTTSHTPVFNSICGVNLGVGDEPDFVRIRQNATGNDQDTQGNPDYTNSLTATCNAGDKFDVHTYIHNDAMSDDNGNGAGSAVAHNVELAMQAPLNTQSNHFTFGSTISASNAETVSDTASLGCGSNVELKLVPSTVHVYSQQYGWANLADSTVNGTTPIGSPTVGSGDQWGCWNYRVVVVYQVTVVKPTPPPATAQCTLLSIVPGEDRKVTVNNFQVTSSNATLKNVVLNWGDNNTVTLTSAGSVIGQSHQYATAGTYEVSAVATFSVAGQNDIVSGGSGTACSEKVTFSPNQPPVVTPPATPSVPAAPTQLVNTGAGSIVSIFAAVAAASAVAYRWALGRRLSRQ